MKPKEERRFVNVLGNCSRIEHLERLPCIAQGFENSAAFIVLRFGAYRPTTRCIAASVETCSFTL